MTQLQGELAAWTVASILVTGIADALIDTPGGELQRACVVPGEAAWDECECGTLSVSPRRFFVSDEFPEGALGRGVIRTSPCDQPWLVAEYVIQVIRCAPSPQSTGVSVSCERLAVAGQVLLVDAYVTLTTTISILCGMRASDQIIDYVLNDQVTRGPEGSCVGTELIVLVGFMR